MRQNDLVCQSGDDYLQDAYSHPLTCLKVKKIPAKPKLDGDCFIYALIFRLLPFTYFFSHLSNQPAKVRCQRIPF